MQTNRATCSPEQLTRRGEEKFGHPQRYGATTKTTNPRHEKLSAEALHASLSRAPHMLLGTDDGGMTLPPVESVVQSYASLAASLDAASFPPLTRRKPVSSPIRSHKNHRETRGRERQEKKQEALVPLPGEHSALQALAPDDPIVEDLEAKVMANFVKFERNMTRLVEEREAAPRLRAAVADHRRVSLLPTAAAASAATGNDDSVSDEEPFHKSPSRRAVARAARKLNRERQAKEESHFDPAHDPWFTAPSNAKPLESLQDAITQAEYRELQSRQFHMAGSSSTTVAGRN